MMGRDRLKIRIRKAQPLCTYCGVSPTEQVDHCPPKSVFVGSLRPKGLEFGCCDECHQPTRAIDQIAATFSRLMPAPVTDDEKADIWKYARATANNYPDIMALFQGGQTMNDGNIAIQISGDNAARMHYAMNAFSARLAMALYRHRVGRPVGPNMRVYATYYTANEILNFFGTHDRVSATSSRLTAPRFDLQSAPPSATSTTYKATSRWD